MSSVLLTIVAGRDTGVPESELVTLGRYRVEEDMHVLEYEETELSGARGTTATIRFGGNVVSMERRGAESSNFTIEKGKPLVAQYETPLGLYSVAFLGTRLDYSIAGDEGRMELRYHIDVGGEAYGNRLELNFKPTMPC